MRPFWDSALDFTLGLVAGLAFMGAVWGTTALHHTTDAQDLEYQVNSRARYPNEQEAAQKACGSRRLMSWWISDPRKSGAMMHVRCSGVVDVDVEVKF